MAILLFFVARESPDRQLFSLAHLAILVIYENTSTFLPIAP
jgi:hypothetical protein